jgi:hypothetical protein
MSFHPTDCYWDGSKPEVIELIKILNTLSPEQEKAVVKYGDALYRAGDNAGYDDKHYD